MRIYRVVVADDHEIVRAGVRLSIESLGDGFSVVGEAADGAALVRMCRELEPDLAVIDVKMPVIDGVAASRQLSALPKPPRVVALSAHADSGTVREMLAAGAVGYVLKTEVAGQLVSAVRAVAAGGVYLSPSVAGFVVDLAVRKPNGGSSGQRRLSPREHEVLVLVAAGQSTKEIAAKLGVSVKTIETQRKALMDKLGIFSVAGLTKYAVREGLVEP